MVAFLGAVLVVLLLSAGVFLLMGGRFRSRASDRPGITEVPRTPEVVAEAPGPEALPPKHASGLMRQVSDKDIEWEIRSGRVFNAIRLYREQTGADAQEARSAVEAWRNRLTAS